jgi:REP element-mobilizing transposase RayT
MRHHVFVHLVWTTRWRAPTIDARVAAFLDAFVRRVAIEERATVLEVGMVRTHVHLLVRLTPQTALSRLVQRLKGGSARLAVEEGHSPRTRALRWEKGYSVHSVSPRVIAIVGEYIRHQPFHHPDEAIDGWPPGLTDPPPSL